MTSGFLNPYHFVPALPRDPDGPFRDREAAGHDRLHGNLWTGRLDVTLTTVTPLLIPNLGPVKGRGHQVVGTRVTEVDGEQRVYLPPTSVKGALRSAYEAVTNSRMGVFSHSKPLGYRPDASANSEPVMIRTNPDGTAKGAIGCLWLDYPGRGLMMKAMSLPTYPPVEPCRYPDGQDPAHGDKVSAWVELVDHGKYRYWRVVSIWRSERDVDPPRPAELGSGARASRDHRPVGPGALVRGFVHRTNANIKGKHDERLFAVECVHADPGVTVMPRRKLELTPEVWKRYRDLIADYRAAHVTERRDDIGGREASGRILKPWETHGGGRDRVYAWSRHLYDETGQGPNALETDGWITCYAQCAGNVVRDLQPVLISRALHHNAPDSIVPANVEPADDLGSLSPADRVFGWVRRSESNDKEDADGAVGGALRIGPVHGPLVRDAVETLGKGIPLDVLSGPKPTQGRFYVGIANPGGEPEPLPRDAPKDSFYSSDKVIRGRKVYPHQRGTESAEYWDHTRRGQEFRRPGDVRDEQNRTITDWVRAGQRFTFTIHLRNLDDLELGALLWLLDPDRLGADGVPGRHRLGGGKPFGFGSVELRLAATGHDVRRGRDWAEDFASLGAVEPPRDEQWRDLAARFEQEVDRTVLSAVRKTAAGFDGSLPVHYPRLEPRKSPDTESYKWFVENERPRRGEIKGKDAEALPPFGHPLPYDVTPPDRRSAWRRT